MVKFTTQFVLNGFCKINEHSKCPGKSRGSKSDPVHFECICECHPWNKKSDLGIIADYILDPNRKISK